MSAKSPSTKKPTTSNALDHVKTILELAEAGLRGIGIPGVEAIPAIPLKIIAIYEATKTNEEDLKDLLVHIDMLNRAILAPIQGALKHGGELRVPKDVRDRIKELNGFSDLEDSIAPFEGLTYHQRILNRSRLSSVLREVNRSIQQAIGIFQLGGQVTDALLLRDLDAERVLSHIRFIDAGYKASSKKPCLNNTRVDVLRAIHKDLTRPALAFVCLYGSPGTGKSAVAKSIAAEVDAQSQTFAASYFFDKRSSAGNVDLKMFISTLTRQFADASSAFRASLISQLKERPLRSDVDVDELLQRLLLGPLQSLPVTEHSLIIVLDALDECGDPSHQRRLIALLCRCLNSPRLRLRLTFFLTTRPETVIMEALQTHYSAFHIAVHWMDNVNSARTTADIETFVAAQLGEIVKLARSPSIAPSSSEVANFAALSGGLFELAAARLRQVQYQCEEADVSLSEAIRIVREGAQLSSPNESPLQDFYCDMVQTAYAHPKATRRDLLLRWYRDVVGALVALREPLAFGALCALVGIDEGDARRVLRPLSSVISISTEGSINFYHASFLEFVLSSPDNVGFNTNPLSAYLIGRVEAHTALAKRALIIMNQLLRQNILNLAEYPMLNPDIPDFLQYLSQNVPEHLKYACLHWADHLQTEDLSACRELLMKWCEEKVVFYLEVLSLLGEVDCAVSLLDIGERWCLKAENSGTTATLLNDCQRLVQMVYPAISKSAEAVYSSAIPFMPSCRLHERYSHLGDARLNLVRGRLSAWPAQIWAEHLGTDVWCVAMSPDGQVIASGCNYGRTYLISATTGRIEHELKGHRERVSSVAFSPDGARIVSGSYDDSVRIWSVASGEQERVLNGHRGFVNSVAFSPDGAHIVSGSYDDSVRVWSVTNGEQEQVLHGHSKAVISVAFSSDGARIVSGSHDDSVRVWSVASGEQEQVLNGHSKGVGSVAFSPDGARIVSGSFDHSVRIWSVASGEEEQILHGHSEAVTSVDFSPDGACIVSGSFDYSVRLWSVASGEEERVLHGHSEAVTSIDFSPDGGRIVSGSFDHSVRIWSVASGEEERVLNGHSKAVNSVAFSPDGGRIVSGSDDHSVRIWSVASGEEERVLNGHKKAVNSVTFSPDGASVVSGSKDISVRVWSAASGEQQRVLYAHNDTVTSVAFSPDGGRIVSGSDDFSVRLWSVTSGEQERVLNGHRLCVKSVAFSSDGQGIKSIDWRGNPLFWAVETGLEVDQDHAIARWSFTDAEFMKLKDGWLRINGRSVWIPRYIQGGWLSEHDTVVLRPDDSPEKLAFIRLRSNRDSVDTSSSSSVARIEDSHGPFARSTGQEV